MTPASRLAPAKINLYLHVGAPEANGYHPLQSLVVFADIGDRLALRDQPGLAITGPFAAHLSNGDDNFVLKAARLFEQATGKRYRGGFVLDKQLPLASGMGGGSADAGACLHLLCEALAPSLGDAELAAISARIGSDGPMCLWSRTALAEGYGERLTDIDLPAIPAVLINPLVDCPTRPVYQRFDAENRFESIDIKLAYNAVRGANDLIDMLANTRNDLQNPAISLQPAISEVLASLLAESQTRMARMSGSGATCFALCASDDDAKALGARMQAVWPSAWVRACRLG